MSRNIALETTRVAIVIGIVQLQILITVILGPIIQGKSDREKITPKIILGSALNSRGYFHDHLWKKFVIAL